MRPYSRYTGAGALGVAALLLGLLAPGAEAQAPIKIGFLAPLTGAFAQIGKDLVNGSDLYLDEIGHQVAGRKIEVIVEDTQGDPSTALTKARKLVEQDKVKAKFKDGILEIVLPKAEKAKPKQVKVEVG